MVQLSHAISEIQNPPLLVRLRSLYVCVVASHLPRLYPLLAYLLGAHTESNQCLRWILG